MDSGQSSPIVSSLLSVPLEIRIKVYHACFVDTVMPYCMKATVLGELRWSLVDEKNWPLLLTCKQIYAEALPECFRLTNFHYLNEHVFGRMAENVMCAQNLRLLTIEPRRQFLGFQHLLSFRALEQVRMSRMRAFEPLGLGTRRDPQYDPLSYATLELATLHGNQIYWPDPEPVSQMKQLEDDYLSLCASQSDSNRSRPHFILHYDYSYSEKTNHPDGWGGKTSKRTTELEYDQTEGMFIITINEDGKSIRQVVRPSNQLSIKHEPLSVS